MLECTNGKVSLAEIVDEVNTKVMVVEGSITKTVASESSVNSEDFDFANLEEALLFVKSVNSDSYINLSLDDGIHYLTDNDIFRKGLFFRGSIHSTSRDATKCSVEPAPNSVNADYVKLFTFLGSVTIILDITFNVKGLDNYISPIHTGAGSSLTLYDCIFNVDNKSYYCISSHENTKVKIYNCSFISTTTPFPKLAIIQSNSSFSFRGCTFSNGDILAYTGFVNAHAVFRDCTYNNITSYSNMNINEVNKNGTYVKIGDLSPMTTEGDNGNTSSRPIDPNVNVQYFDTDLNKPIWYNGTDWVDAIGTVV